MKRLAAFLALAIALSLVRTAAAEPTEGARIPSVYAGGAILIEADSERVLYERDADERLPMASTTKIMTALIALEAGNLTEVLPVADEAVGVEGSSLYLRKGETISLIDLLYGLLLRSGNDAAVAIAIRVAGSVDAFLAKMNARAAELGCTNTHFVTVNGLDDADHYSSARDMARITAEALRREDFRTIVNSRSYQITGSQPRLIYNKNRLLWEYEGGCGVKTGYTVHSGKCLVFAAKREGMTLIGVVLDCPSMWNSAKALLDYGFAAYALAPLFDAEASYGGVLVEKGIKKELSVVPKEGILYPLQDGEAEKLRVFVQCAESVTAPVQAGDTVGSLSVQLDGMCIASVELVLAEGSGERDYAYLLERLLRAYSNGA